MRIGSIVSECVRDIESGTTHAVAMMLAVLCSGLLLGGYEAVGVVGLETQAVTRINALADTRMIIASGDLIDGTVCDRLPDAANGPDASGALRAGDQVTPLSTPGKDIASYEVTPGLLRILAAGDRQANASSTPVSDTVDASGIWVSTDLADDFGLTVGSRLATDHGGATVAGVFAWPNDGRDTRLAYALVVPVSASAAPFGECWARQWPASGQTDNLLYSTVIVSGESTGGQAGVMAVNKGFDSHYDAHDSYTSRMTRWMPCAGLAAGLLIGVVGVRRRRLEYAGALHCGQSKGAQLLGIGLETLTWSGLGTISACSLIAAYCWRMAAGDPVAILLSAIRAPLALFAASMLAAVLAGLFVRESQLFRYFKTR
ncbi:hypothetical protein [Bifidobacterium sp. SO1]|uniref:hypothetical protein n=1 Tax=Bifidobacterium sp. SO1 TaxID=2809029 RepID=UPI001BDD1FE1|nr:hypothetical protein [Bifidobacterium sp. SO1]MBT1162634.1 hypothetical protein [Bifidobacterium sp. SO1]